MYLALTVSDIIPARGSAAGRYLRDAADDLEAYVPGEYRKVSDVPCARFVQNIHVQTGVCFLRSVSLSPLLVFGLFVL